MGVRLTQKEFDAILGKGHVRIAQSPGSKMAAARARHVKSPSPQRRQARPAVATPHDRLWDELRRRFPDEAYRECPACIEGHAYRIDVGLPCFGLAIEMDGWEWHGKHLGDFTRDRTRQNLLTCGGWRVLRYTAKQIRQSMDEVLDEIGHACSDRVGVPDGAPYLALDGLQRVAHLPVRTLDSVSALLNCGGREARIFLDCIEGVGR